MQQMMAKQYQYSMLICPVTLYTAASSRPMIATSVNCELLLQLFDPNGASYAIWRAQAHWARLTDVSTSKEGSSKKDFQPTAYQLYICQDLSLQLGNFNHRQGVRTNW